MTDRLEKIFALIPNCKVFADVGCDHGYIAFEMLKRGKAEKVIIADISKKCLSKAEQLLAPYIEQGKAVSVVADGFNGLPDSEVGLVAGMGGEEICSILVNAKTLPKTLVLQPMKNADKVRKCVVKMGYKLQKDFVFFSADKFYDIMLLSVGKDSLTDEEIEFGRDNIKGNNPDFIKQLNAKICVINQVLANQNLSDETKEKLVKEKNKLEKYV